VVVAEAGREGQEISRRIRDELERIRDAEMRVEHALENVRQARQRVEVIARDLGREEMRVRALVREELRAAAELSTPARASAPVEPRTEPEPVRPWRSDTAAGWSRRPAAPEVDALPSALPEPIRVEGPVMVPPTAAPRRGSDAPLPRASAAAAWAEQRSKLIGIGAAAVIAVTVIGWLAIRGLQRGSAPGPQPEVAVRETPPAVPLADQPAPAAPVPSAPGATSVLVALPADAPGRTALYDSLWAARSPLFAPLLAAVERDSEDRAIGRAVASWRAGSVDMQEGDLLHSALVQQALNLRLGRDLEIDGQLLRNPCRGTSCSALLDLWRAQSERYGFPAMPADAATNTTALRQVEVALVLDWMKDTAETGPAHP
jgi:hypothetical protein